MILLIAIFPVCILSQNKLEYQRRDIIDGIKLLQQATERYVEIDDSLLLRITNPDTCPVEWDDNEMHTNFKQVLASDTIVIVSPYYYSKYSGYVRFDIINSDFFFSLLFYVVRSDNGPLLKLKRIYGDRLFDLSGENYVEIEDLLSLFLYSYFTPLPEFFFKYYELKEAELSAIRIIRHNNYTEYTIYSPIKENMNLSTTTTIRKYHE